LIEFNSELSRCYTRRVLLRSNLTVPNTQLPHYVNILATTERNKQV